MGDRPILRGNSHQRARASATNLRYKCPGASLHPSFRVTQPSSDKACIYIPPISHPFQSCCFSCRYLYCLPASLNRAMPPSVKYQTYPFYSASTTASTSTRTPLHIKIGPLLRSLALMNMGSNAGVTGQSFTVAHLTAQEALEIARDSPNGVQDSEVSSVLEAALAVIWARIQAHPSSYVMTRDEFAIFNYFQDRFEGLPLAVAARKRYWDRQ